MGKTAFLLVSLFALILVSGCGSPYGDYAGNIVTVGANNSLIVNGEPFFPVGIYWVPRGKNWVVNPLPDIARAGFNFVHPHPDEFIPLFGDSGIDLHDPVAVQSAVDDFIAWLDAVDSQGMKSCIYLKGAHDFAVGDIDWEYCAGVILRLYEHPAVLCYYLMDEPENYLGHADRPECAPAYLRDLVDRIHAIDPYHPVMLTNFNPDVFQMYAAIPDVYSTNNFPVSWHPVSIVADWLDSARLSMRTGEPLWSCLQAFGGSSDHPAMPTPAEIRCMTYLALNHGATGIQYFRFEFEHLRGTAGSIQTPELWNEMVLLAGEMAVLAPAVLAGTHLEDPPVCADGAMDCAAFVLDDVTWLSAVNASETGRTVDFSVPVPQGRAEAPFETAPTVTSTAAGFRDVFGPWQAHVYRYPSPP